MSGNGIDTRHPREPADDARLRGVLQRLSLACRVLQQAVHGSADFEPALVPFREVVRDARVAVALWLQQRAARTEQDQQEARLRFVRWLVQTRRLSDWPLPPPGSPG